MTTKKEMGKEFRLGLFLPQFDNQLTIATPSEIMQESNVLRNSPKSLDYCDDVCSHSTTTSDDQCSSLCSSSRDMNSEVVSALRNRFKPRQVLSAVLKRDNNVSLKKNFDLTDDLTTNSTFLQTTSCTFAPKRYRETIEEQTDYFNIDKQEEPVKKIAKTQQQLFEHQPNSPFHPVRNTNKRRYAEFLGESEQELTSKRMKYGYESSMYRAVPLTIEEINEIDQASPQKFNSNELLVPVEEISKNDNNSLSLRSQLPIYRKLKPQITNETLNFTYNNVGNDKNHINEMAKLERFHQNCLRKWFKSPTAQTLTSTGLGLKSILKKSRTSPAWLGEPEVNVPAAGLALMAAAVSKPTFTVQPISLSTVSSSGLQTNGSTMSTGSMSQPNLSFAFSGTPAIPSTFQFGQPHDLTSAFPPASNLFNVTPNINRTFSTSSSRRKRR